ncbi:MFS general substrate transporter [Aspergillus brunneoviolaceus CBS 621.78]|uniref:MFS general substrate transporter n=1 Tax=Aspergillus brunneoviolaceus CBS 621.78 TaxID=1450534 RepID=A0ACD1G2U1_9EURO|nr:MFS general substrate transporter [Aspergillus brunneoviolaceus CBS 621.78]RAH43523.1 MFS general substrate transporter [Aspergillus brunneoviolaceus CBS 621.78]
MFAVICGPGRTDYLVLPLLATGFATYQIDRTNIASALTGGFASAISVDQNTINLGNQLLFLGVILLEIPSNMALQRVGPHRWIGAQVFIFGVLAALQIFIRNRTGFLITRAVLGLAEAGYIPAAMYTLSTWYTKEQLTKRIAIFFFGMFGGAAIAPLLGAALLKLDGRGGLAGWKWIFLVEGLWSIIMALLLFISLPDRPPSPRESNSPTTRNSNRDSGSSNSSSLDKPTPDQPPTSAANERIPWILVYKTITNTAKWPHFLATGCVFATWSPLTTYTPSIIMSLGFNRIAANALAAIGNLITLPVIFLFAWLSDATGKRGCAVLLAIGSYLIALVVLRAVQPHVGRWGHVGLWTMVNGLAVGYHPVHNAWIQVNCGSAGERSIIVMSATAGLMAGSQIFRAGEADDFYPRGLVIMIVLVAVGFVLVVVQMGIYRFTDGKKGRPVEQECWE